SLLRPAIISIAAPGAGVSVPISVLPAKVVVRNGTEPGPVHLRVTADSSTLIELSSVPLRFGLPDSMTKEGRGVNKKLFTGQLKVKGMTTHLGKLTRFNKLLSVA